MEYNDVTNTVESDFMKHNKTLVEDVDKITKNGKNDDKSSDKSSDKMSDDSSVGKKVKRVYSPQQKKAKRISNILLGFSILLILVAIVLFLIDPIQNMMRKKVTEEALSEIQTGISAGQTEITIIVDSNANQVNGEEYDYIGSEAERAAQSEAIESQESSDEQIPSNVTLTSIGILTIDSVNIELPIWSDASKISLRYGTGHFEGSAMPGQDGNCTILGHHMREEGSIFNRLDEVRTGDSAVITSVDGNTYTYIIDNIIIVNPEDLGNYIYSENGTGKQLTLITCSYTGVNGATQRLLVIGHMA